MQVASYRKLRPGVGDAVGDGVGVGVGTFSVGDKINHM